MYTSKLYRKCERIKLKTLNKSSWYSNKSKSKGRWRASIPQQWKPKLTRQRNIDGIDVTSVMIVPNTRDSVLLNGLIKKEAQISRITGYSLKLVEGNGTPLARMLPIILNGVTCGKKVSVLFALSPQRKVDATLEMYCMWVNV